MFKLSNINGNQTPDLEVASIIWATETWRTKGQNLLDVRILFLILSVFLLVRFVRLLFLSTQANNASFNKACISSRGLSNSID